MPVTGQDCTYTKKQPNSRPLPPLPLPSREPELHRNQEQRKASFPSTTLPVVHGYLLDKCLSRIYCLLSPRVGSGNNSGREGRMLPSSHLLPSQQSDFRKCSCHAEEKQICPDQGRLKVRNTKPRAMLTLTEETHTKPRDRGQFTMSKE